ncbi:MAG: hypothetical protein KDD19_04005 [Phaeodactylibacter sp.]|nr:hypothetical protein [Phaeodactylibacter sp.]MCB9052545.1 hypothetical protein [Lewinellaceae bacterium]
MKALAFLMAFCFLASFRLYPQSSNEDYSGFIDVEGQSDAYTFGSQPEPAVYNQVKREVQAQVTGPVREWFRAEGGSRLFNLLLLGLFLVGLACFFSTFSRHRQGRSAKQSRLLPNGRKAAAKAS